MTARDWRLGRTIPLEGRTRAWLRRLRAAALERQQQIGATLSPSTPPDETPDAANYEVHD